MAVSTRRVAEIGGGKRAAVLESDLHLDFPDGDSIPSEQKIPRAPHDDDKLRREQRHKQPLGKREALAFHTRQQPAVPGDE